MISKRSGGQVKLFFNGLLAYNECINERILLDGR